jgi:hypothetical protein
MTDQALLISAYARRAESSANTLSRDRGMPNKHYPD